MSYKYMQKVVCEFQDDDEIRLNHYNDLKYTSMMLYNMIVKGLRSGRMGSFVDKVLEVSGVIEETTLMQQQIRADEATYKGDMMDFYYGQDMQYRIPNQVNSFSSFRNKKSNKPKDYYNKSGGSN